MRLIDAPIGIFRFDGELVLKTEYYSKDKQSGKYIPDCYIIRTGEYFWGSAKTANELINLDIEPVDFAELLPTVTDTISRQAAIDAIGGNEPVGDPSKMDDDGVVKMWERIRIINIINKLPSAQPERKSGKWIKIKRSDINPLTGRCGVYVGCSECGAPIPTDSQLDYIDESEANYCINCGADMRG